MTQQNVWHVGETVLTRRFKRGIVTQVLDSNRVIVRFGSREREMPSSGLVKASAF